MEKQLIGEAATTCNSLARMENISDNVSSPDEETGLDGNSKLCIAKYNIAAPDFSENISPSKEETGAGLQGKSDLCFNMKYSTTLPDNTVIGVKFIYIPQSSRIR